MKDTQIKLLEEYLKSVDFDKLLEDLYSTNVTKVMGHGLSLMEYNNILGYMDSKNKTSITIGQFLIDKMNKKKLIQQELADKASVSKHQMSMILKGGSASMKTLIRLSLVLELNLNETKELLELTGKSFGRSNKDKVIVACIDLEIYDVIKVEEALNEFAHDSLY